MSHRPKHIIDLRMLIFKLGIIIGIKLKYQTKYLK